MENGLADLLDSSSGMRQLGPLLHQASPFTTPARWETISLVAAADENQMTEYFTFRTRQVPENHCLLTDSSHLTEKTAERKLGLSVGDSFEWDCCGGGRRP